MVGFKPTTPQQAAGIRIARPPSVPKAMGFMPKATDTAAPPLEPPLVTSGLNGFSVKPDKGDSVNALCASSGVAVLPSKMAPDLRARATARLSSCATYAGSTVEP